MDIRYGRGRFSVRDRVAVAAVRYTVGPPVQERAVFCTGRAPGHASQTGQGGKPPHKAFFALPPATGNGEQLTILFFMPNFEPLFISTVNDNRRTGSAGHP